MKHISGNNFIERVILNLFAFNLFRIHVSIDIQLDGINSAYYAWPRAQHRIFVYTNEMEMVEINYQYRYGEKL